MIGHQGKDCETCQRHERCCYRCGQKGHDRAQCQTPAADIKCASCRKMSKPDDHETASERCWAYQVAKQRAAAMTNYG